MPTTPSVKPSQKAVKTYYEALGRYAEQNVDHESAVRSAFQNLLDQTGRRFGWTLIPELSEKADGHRVQPDGTFRDEFQQWVRERTCLAESLQLPGLRGRGTICEQTC